MARPRFSAPIPHPSRPRIHLLPNRSNILINTLGEMMTDVTPTTELVSELRGTLLQLQGTIDELRRELESAAAAAASEAEGGDMMGF